MNDKEFRQAYDALELKYEISLQFIQAPLKVNLTQDELAKHIGTTQSVITSLNSVKTLPSLQALSQYAKAIGKNLHLD